MTQEKTPKRAPAPAAPELPLLAFQGVCNSWECDHFNHMNVRFYVNRAYQAWAPFAAAIGLPHAFRRGAVSTLRPRDMHIRFHREIRAGEHMNMRAGILAVTDDTVTLYQEARKAFSDGDVSATMISVLEHVEAHTGKIFPWSKKVRDSFARLMIPAAPDHGAPRSVALDPPRDEASLARALALKIPISGLSAIRPDECDAFGRMLPEFLLGRQSDSGGMHLLRVVKDQPAAPVEGPRFGLALLEARLHFKNWPVAGDLIQVHSGLIASSPKTIRTMNWTVDPVSGEAWGAIEAVAAHFDLDQRRAAARPPEFLAQMDKHLLKDFVL